ncbi:MAG TPA: winged helix-turn-helix transcriptional regulator [Gemmatimonadales bacterium]|nr:winged helix-turn-helix transcriptional regulator [Gemmatimonadales bacterium]
MASPVPESVEGYLPRSYRGARGQVLIELKRAGRATVRELGTQLGLSVNAVRHHLKELEAAGLVAYEREQRKSVGAPRFSYALTPAGEAVFPQRYKETLTELLDHLVAREGREAAVAFLVSRYDALADRLGPELAAASPAERMRIVTRVRADDGYMAEGHATFCCGTLTEHHCAIREVSARFPEICEAESRFLERVLGGRVERKLHLLNGDGACEYAVRFNPAPDAGPTETA